MRLIYKLSDLFTKPIPEKKLDAKIDRALNTTFLFASNYEYGWNTETINRNPSTIKAIVTMWNSQIKNEFIRLVSDPDTLRRLEFDTQDVHEIAMATNAMDDRHDFCGFWHVLERNDIGCGIEFHTLIHPCTLSQILRNPEDYVLVTGETVIKI